MKPEVTTPTAACRICREAHDPAVACAEATLPCMGCGAALKPGQRYRSGGQGPFCVKCSWTPMAEKMGLMGGLGGCCNASA